MRLLRVLVTADVYGKHYDELTSSQKERVLEIAVALKLRNEYLEDSK